MNLFSKKKTAEEEKIDSDARIQEYVDQRKRWRDEWEEARVAAVEKCGPRPWHYRIGQRPDTLKWVITECVIRWSPEYMGQFNFRGGHGDDKPDMEVRAYWTPVIVNETDFLDLAAAEAWLRRNTNLECKEYEYDENGNRVPAKPAQGLL